MVFLGGRTHDKIMSLIKLNESGDLMASGKDDIVQTLIIFYADNMIMQSREAGK
jgi:hypothetical protein